MAMHIISPNLRQTTREHHKRFRTFVVTTKQHETRIIEKKMPRTNAGERLWV